MADRSAWPETGPQKSQAKSSYTQAWGFEQLRAWVALGAWEEVVGVGCEPSGNRAQVNLQPETRLRNVLRRLMRSKDMP